MNYMQQALSEIITMPQLVDLWTANVAAIRTLPEAQKQEIVRIKDETKARVQKV